MIVDFYISLYLFARMEREGERERSDHAPTKVYAIRARKETVALDVIVDTFSSFDISVHTLVHSRLTHSYIYTSLVVERNIPVETTEF